jgi:benzodiazapine receptor
MARAALPRNTANLGGAGTGFPTRRSFSLAGETQIMLAVLRNAAEAAVNGKGRSASHIATGAALVTGAVALSALIAATHAPTRSNAQIKADYDRLKQPGFKPPEKTFAVVWPPMFLLLTVSGLRIWNAPASPERTKALGLWGVVQGLNALWMALGPKRLPAQTVTAVASLGTSLAYAREAAKVDKVSAELVTPFLGWITFANLLTGEVFRLNRRKFEPAYKLH